MNWITSVPNGWRRILARVQRGADLIVLDPYRTASAAAATAHSAVLPGQDWAFLLGMLKVIFDNGLHDRAACEAEHGLEDLRRLADDARLPTSPRVPASNPMPSSPPVWPSAGPAQR